MKRKIFLTARKGMAVAVTVAVVMSQGMIAYADDPQPATSTVVADATDQDEENDNVEASSVTITDVESNDESYAVKANSTEEKKAEAKVTGDVSISGNAYGIIGVSAVANGGEVDVNTGNVNAENTQTSGNSKGVSASTSSAGGKVDVNTGDVSATNTSAGGRANGVSVAAYGGTVTVKTGKVTENASNNGNGVTAYTKGEDTEATVTTGAISAKGINGNQKGVEANITDYSKLNMSVDGGIEASSNGIEASVYGIKAEGYSETEFNITVVNGGINVNAANAVAVDVTTKGSANVVVDGDVTSNDDGIKLTANQSDSRSASVMATVNGDVKADDTALVINKKSDDSTVWVESKGTIDGGKHNIVLEENSTVEDLNIRVWKIETKDKEGKDKALVETKKTVEEQTVYEELSEKDTKKMIDYIIKVDKVETEGGKLTPSAYVAQEGERVYLEVTVPTGYSLDSFYSVDDAGAADVKVILDQESGKYYLEVPRGGGVFVGVKMKEDKLPDNNDNNNNSNNNNNNSNNSNNANGNNNPVNNNPSNVLPSGDSASGDSSSNDSSSGNVGNSVGSGSSDNGNYSPVIPGPKTLTVNNQPMEKNIYITNLNDSLKQSFSEGIAAWTPVGMMDLDGRVVAVPENATLKDSFTFTAEDATGIVTAYIEFKNYKAGDIIMCSYLDPLGNNVVVAITPDMVNGTSLLLRIPAYCHLALAGSAV